jgi:protein-disulfide isomerase
MISTAQIQIQLPTKDSMARNVALTLIVALNVALAFAQQNQNAPKHAVAAAHPSQTAPSPAGLPSEETVNGFLQQTFGWDTQTSWKIVSIKPSPAQGLAEVTVRLVNPQGEQNTTFYVSEDQKHAVLGQIIPFGTKPFAADQDRLEKGVNGPSRGPANSGVLLVEFSDLQCPHCKDAQPIVEKLVADEPNARFVYQQFPLPMHDWAFKAGSYADCLGRSNKDAFWKFIDAVFNAQSDITAANADEKLKSLVTSSGGNAAEAAACAVKPDTKSRIDHSLALGKSVDVTGTPTLFINGRKISDIKNTPPDILKKLVDFAAQQGK